MIGWIEGPLKYLDSKFGVNIKPIIIGLWLVCVYFAFTYFDLEANKVFGYMVATAPIWLPIIMFLLFFDAWLFYVRKDFDLNYGRTTLEIKLPQEIFKSPEAMELVLNQMHQTASADNHKETYIDGKHPPTFGLELVSRGGDVRFYVSVPKKRFKDIVEAQFYAQYPGIEVHELDIDYTAEIPWDPTRFSMFSLHMGLKKPDAYPIKTYIEYGLESMPKEEEKIDPITTMLEFLGSLGPGEQAWVQILIEANREVTFKEGSLKFRPNWIGEAREEIKKIIDEAVEKRGGETNKGNLMMLLTDTEKGTIEAIERSLSKNAFNTAIRTMYIAPVDKFRIGDRVPAMITAWRSYDDNNRNSIGVRWRTDFDWNWWQDPKGTRRATFKRLELNEYKRRIYIHKSPIDKPKVMTTEELATLFHLPGKVATTPSLGRIPSKRAEPPVNLPIG